MYDEMTKEIIREIPPERTNVILNKIHDLAGIVVDEKR
ncbi:FlaG domain protein [Fusobacterium sp. CM21]|nr:FlaG domain protein [Fusobacterium sp. CM21]